MPRCPHVLTVYLSIQLPPISLFTGFNLPFHSCHLDAPSILALPLILSPSSASLFFFFTFPCKFSLLSFTRRGLLPTRVPPPTPLSIHYPFIVLDFITTLDFSSVYICMETPDSFGRMPPTAARFMTFSFSSHFACAHGCMRITSRFTVHTTVCARRPGRLCRAKLPSRQVGVYAHETWIRRVWWWNCYLLIPWSVTLMSPSQYIL